MQEPIYEKLYSNQTNANEAYFSPQPNFKYTQKSGDDYIEKASRVLVVADVDKKEFMVVGYILNDEGTYRISVIIKNNLGEVLEIPIQNFTSTYRLMKVLRESVAPELIYLNGVPDKIVSGQHWVAKDNSSVDVFNNNGSYFSDETPSTVWEVQSVIDDEVTLNLIQQEDHQSGFLQRTNSGQILKLTRLELVTRYRLHSFGFHLSNDFYKFIQNETYVAPENRDKILMMGKTGKGQYVQLDDLVGPPKVNNNINVDIF